MAKKNEKEIELRENRKKLRRNIDQNATEEEQIQ